jgi:ketosteroid isomerase-like protein
MKKMKFKIGILLFVIFAISGCKQITNKEEVVANSQTELEKPEKGTNYLKDWVGSINNSDNTAIEKIYASNAIKIVSVDSIIESSSQIAEYFGNKKNKISSIESLFKIEANKRRQINYEIISYKTEDQLENVQLLIWRLENGKVIREFEFTESRNQEAKNVDITTIADTRKRWMELCNANNAKNLVNQLYSANTIYFNHKPLIIGTKDLIKEYNYMNRSDYSLHLQPLKLEIVNANFAFEIGQCSGGYKGKYILIWERQSDGNWKIHIDSNI